MDGLFTCICKFAAADSSRYLVLIYTSLIGQHGIGIVIQGTGHGLGCSLSRILLHNHFCHDMVIEVYVLLTDGIVVSKTDSCFLYFLVNVKVIKVYFKFYGLGHVYLTICHYKFFLIASAGCEYHCTHEAYK